MCSFWKTKGLELDKLVPGAYGKSNGPRRGPPRTEGPTNGQPGTSEQIGESVLRLSIEIARATFYVIGLAALVAVALPIQGSRFARAWAGRASARARARIYRGFEGEGRRRW